MGKISVIGTPIGNMGDITFRAIETLSSCDMVICEDTRVTQKLFQKYNIKTPKMSYHSKSGLQGIDKIIKLLKEDKHLSLVSDAGTPCISDPGSLLISKIKEDIPNCNIETVPGPSALISALSIAGCHTENFIFYGFMPNKKGRQTLLNEIKNNEMTSIVYESTHRIEKLLNEIKSNEINKKITVAKELTKIHEKIIQGNIDQVMESFSKDKTLFKGEFVIIFSK